MHEKLDKGLFFSFIGNLLFVVFGLLCGIYYYTYNDESLHSRLLEALAYCSEFLGFGLLIYSDVLLSQSLRLRRLLKISYSAYIVLEALMMVLELNSGRLDFYAPYSLGLSIIHAIVSGAACLAFLQLDPENTRYEVCIVVCIAMTFFGMLGTLFGVRVYFSILTNAISFTLLFAAIRYLLSREEIEIDCYGDRARVAEYKSSMFAEVPEKKTPAAGEEFPPAQDEGQDNAE